MENSKNWGDKLFDVCNVALMVMIGLVALYPFWHTLVLSFSDAASANTGGIQLWPRRLSLESYFAVLKNREIVVGLFNSVLRTAVGVGITLLLTAMTAYPLARPETPWRKPLTMLVLFTMVFTGGIVPTYLVISQIGLLDNRLVYVLPVAVSAFNVIVLKNFFQAIPESFAEAARMEGANDFQILFRIYIPLSLPALATVGLWTAVFHWNSWLDGLLYITSDSKQVLQIFLQRIVVEGNTDIVQAGASVQTAAATTSETIKAATVIVTILPMILLYPFVQRYFQKGIMLGGVKE